MLDEVERAIPTFVVHQRSDDPQLVAALIAGGRSRQLAQTLATFVPIAVARVLLAKLNVRCSDTFKYVGRGGGPMRHSPFAAESVFVAAAQLASRGLGEHEVMAVGGRSAEFKAVNRLLLNGSRPENVKLVEPVLAWAGPGANASGSVGKGSGTGWLGRLFGR